MKKNTKLFVVSCLVVLFVISGIGISTADYNSNVYTPNNTKVYVNVRTTELSPSQIASLNASVSQTYPQATRESNSSRKYNCHSYAWHSQSTSNNKWMFSPEDDKYWTDGSYSLITITDGGVLPIASSIPNGAKVSYKASDHSAIKISSSYYRSKWGTWPIMKHKPGYSPYACGPNGGCCFPVGYYKR